MKSLGINKFGTYGEPRKILWSAFHGVFFVMCRQTVNTWNHSTGETKVVHGSDTHEFTDMDLSTAGWLVLATRELASGTCSAKVIKDNLFSITSVLETAGEEMDKVLFVSANTPMVSSHSGTTSFFRLLPPYAAPVATSAVTTGNVIMLSIYIPSSIVFAVTSGGEVWHMPATGGNPVLAGTVSGTKKVTTAVSGTTSTVESTVAQDKARVYVGSREWMNDMWDSGETSTSSSTMPYGGGDNLKPGHRYWVHVMTHHPDSGWSAPQTRSFVMPKE